jgi:DNA-binding transcriptional LysR family regulator
MESTAASRLPPILARFNEAAPTTSLRLTLGASRELTKAVMTGELDCALVARQADRSEGIHATGIDMNAFHSVRVYQEDLLILLPPDHPPVSEPSDIRLPALAALEPGCTYRQIAEQWFRGGAGVPTVELTSYHAILAHVLAGNAAGVMPRSVLEMLPWNRDVTVHRLGIVDTLLISRREARSEPLQAFEQIVLMSSDRPATRQ